MADGDCLKISEKEFCYSRKSPCPCSKQNKYEAHNEDTVASWGKYLQRRASKVKGNKKLVAKIESTARSAEHHHIMCVAEIQSFLSVDKAYQNAIATNWCINEKKNLIALPKWELHFMHYFHLANAEPEIRSKPDLDPDSDRNVKNAVEPPPFADLPMHDQRDHSVYSREVKADLLKLAQNLEVVKKCEDPKTTLQKDLDALSDKYAEQLKNNGKMLGGTHAGWEQGLNDPESDWYLPFSMSRNPRPLVHPCIDGEFSRMMKNLHDAFWLEDNPAIFD